MNGPCQHPPSWPTATIAPIGYDDMHLRQLPQRNPRVAMAFSIKQVGSDGPGKICWGEDWRCSGHNSTCIMRDQPFHHTSDHFASLPIQTHQIHPGSQMNIWGHDHNIPRRSIPTTSLGQPRECLWVSTHTRRTDTLEPQCPSIWFICQCVGIQPLWRR